MSEPDDIMRLHDRLIHSPIVMFPIDGVVQAVNDHGVYIIRTAKSNVLHVGRTQRGENGLNQRLQNHLSNQSSFARNFLKPEGINLRVGYTYQYIVVHDPRARALLEALSTGLLCPAHIGTGEGKSKST